MPYPVLTSIPNFKRICPCLQNPQQIQMCIIFILKQFTVDFSLTSFMWHVLIDIVSNILTQYENNRTYSVVTMVTKRQMYDFYIEE
jgi:hypothetical protein